MERCPSCKGTGYKSVEVVTSCSTCQGTGHKHGRTCPVCYGRAKAPVQVHTRCLECDALEVMSMNSTVQLPSPSSSKNLSTRSVRSSLMAVAQLLKRLQYSSFPRG